MYNLQALQTNGTWYTLSKHGSLTAAENEMWSHAGWRYSRVKYRIIETFLSTHIETHDDTPDDAQEPMAAQVIFGADPLNPLHLPR